MDGGALLNVPDRDLSSAHESSPRGVGLEVLPQI